jgi:arylsulfatase A-like enzyme/tetratricopeptide (TPR) repeat protein
MGPTRSRFRGTLLVVGAAAAVGFVLFLVRARAPRAARSLHARWAERHVDKPNVLLVTLDTTRADHIGCYGDRSARTPAIDALAAGGVLFAQAASVAPLTQPAHSSILTGLYPTYHGVRLNGTTALGEAHTTLAETLAGRGYVTGAFVGAFVLDGRWGLNQGFSVYDDQFDLKKFKHLDLAAVQRPADQVADKALAWLEQHKAEPFFAWVHFYDAHSPYEPPEPFASQFRSGGPAALYDGEIAFADAQLGRLVAWLDAAGLERNTIVVLVGDHGEALGQHGEGTHGYFIYDDVLHVPFVVRAPFDELKGIRVEAQVSVVDVYPTVLALAGLEAGPAVHGRSLVPLLEAPEAEAPAYAYSESMPPSLQFGWSALHSLRSPRYKFIEAPRPELFDLAADPDENTNVFDRNPRVAEEMKSALDRLMEETSRGAPAPEAANLDTDTAERLAALGYLGSAAASRAPAAAGKALADPKDRLAVFTAVQRAGELMVEERYAPAAAALEAALREEPEMAQARLMLGSCYSELDRKAEAKAQFDHVLKADPRSVQALVGLANVLLEEGLTDDVIALCQRTLALDERNTQAYVLLGEAYFSRKEPARAAPYLEKAVAIQPKLTQNRLNLAACLIDMKQLARAQATLEEVVRDAPRFPGAQFNLGVLYEEQGRLDAARAAYQAEVEHYPNGFKARFNLGKLLARGDDWKGSIEQMREVMRIAPKRPEGYLFLARGLLHEAAPLDEVESLAKRGLGLARDHDIQAFGWFLMADVYSRRHETDKVEEALRRARQVASARGAEGARETRGGRGEHES